jgi:hypothetical protein
MMFGAENAFFMCYILMKSVFNESDFHNEVISDLYEASGLGVEVFGIIRECAIFHTL